MAASVLPMPSLQFSSRIRLLLHCYPARITTG